MNTPDAHKGRSVRFGNAFAPPNNNPEENNNA